MHIMKKHEIARKAAALQVEVNDLIANRRTVISEKAQLAAHNLVNYLCENKPLDDNEQDDLFNGFYDRHYTVALAESRLEVNALLHQIDDLWHAYDTTEWDSID